MRPANELHDLFSPVIEIRMRRQAQEAWRSTETHGKKQKLKNIQECWVSFPTRQPNRAAKASSHLNYQQEGLLLLLLPGMLDHLKHSPPVDQG